MLSYPRLGWERGASCGGEWTVISLLKPELVRLPLPGRARRSGDAGELDCVGLVWDGGGLEDLEGVSCGDSNELISILTYSRAGL